VCAEEEDVQPAGAREQRVGRQAHHGQDDAEGDADRHCDDGQLDRDDEPVEDAMIEQVFADDAPLEAGRP